MGIDTDPVETRRTVPGNRDGRRRKFPFISPAGLRDLFDCPGETALFLQIVEMQPSIPAQAP